MPLSRPSALWHLMRRVWQSVPVTFFQPQSVDVCPSHSELFNLCGLHNNLKYSENQWKTMKHFQRSLSTGIPSPLMNFARCLLYWNALTSSIFRINAVSEYAKGLAALPALLNTTSTSRIGHIEPYWSILNNDKLIKHTPINPYPLVWQCRTLATCPRLQESAQPSSQDTPHDLPR